MTESQRYKNLQLLRDGLWDLCTDTLEGVRRDRDNVAAWQACYDIVDSAHNVAHDAQFIRTCNEGDMPLEWGGTELTRLNADLHGMWFAVLALRPDGVDIFSLTE